MKEAKTTKQPTLLKKLVGYLIVAPALAFSLFVSTLSIIGVIHGMRSAINKATPEEVQRVSTIIAETLTIPILGIVTLMSLWVVWRFMLQPKVLTDLDADEPATDKQ